MSWNWEKEEVRDVYL